MKRKLGFFALILTLCLACGCGNDGDGTPPSPENFNIVELRPDGVTFETSHAVNSSYLDDYIDWKVYLSLYDGSNDALIAEELVSQYSSKPRVNYEAFEVISQTFYLKERAEKGGDHVASSKSDSITFTLPQEIPVGTQPVDLAIDESSNCVYVANWQDNTVTKITLGETTETTTIDVGINPLTLVVNSASHKVYVANVGSYNQISVINGIDNSKQNIPVGQHPCAFTVNSALNRIYVANNSDDTVSVIDGSTDAVTATIAVGESPGALALNSTTKTVYVVNQGGNSVTKIAGTTNATTEIAAGTIPCAIAVNETTNKVYVANYDSNNVTVIDGATNETSTIAVGANPVAIAVNPSTNKIYVANWASDTVSVIDGATQAVTSVALGIPASTEGNYYPAIAAEKPCGIAIDLARNRIYVANFGSGNVTVIDAENNNKIFIMKSTGYVSRAIAVNQTTGEIFTVNEVAREVDGHGNVMRSFPVTRSPHE